MNILSLLANDNYIIVNKELIKTIGLEESIAIGDLASMFIYLQKQGELTEDGFFFYTVEAMEENTSLSDYQQRKALKNLKNLELIDMDLRELPAKRFIKLNVENLENLFRTSSQKTKELALKKLKTNNISISKDIDNNILYNTSSKEEDMDVSKKSLLGDTIPKKSKKQKEDKQKAIINNLKKSLFSKLGNVKVIELLGKWIEELYSKGKGIGSNALDIALEQLSSLSEEKQEEVIKKATLNGWRDFNYCLQSKDDDKHFNKEIITDEQKRNQSLAEIKTKIKNGGKKDIDYC